MNPNLTPTVNKQRKPIKYWEAHKKHRIGNFGIAFFICIDYNTSIAILRAKYGNNVIYKSVR